MSDDKPVEQHHNRHSRIVDSFASIAQYALEHGCPSEALVVELTGAARLYRAASSDHRE